MYLLKIQGSDVQIFLHSMTANENHPPFPHRRKIVMSWPHYTLTIRRFSSRETSHFGWKAFRQNQSQACGHLHLTDPVSEIKPVRLNIKKRTGLDIFSKLDKCIEMDEDQIHFHTVSFRYFFFSPPSVMITVHVKTPLLYFAIIPPFCIKKKQNKTKKDLQERNVNGKNMHVW